MRKENITLPVGDDERPVQWLTFDGMTDWSAHIEGLPMKKADEELEGNFNHTFADMHRCAVAGDESLVAKSDAMLSKLEGLADLDSHAFQTINDVAGGAPNVGAFLAGHPAAMRRRQRLLTPAAPIAVLVDVWVQYGVPDSVIVRRGAAVMALVRALTQSRPVTLHLICGHGGNKPIVWHLPIDTAPLDLARAAWALQSPSVLRLGGHRLLFAYTKDRAGYHAFSEEWQREQMPGLIAARLGTADFIHLRATESDGPFSSDAEAAQWVTQELDRFREAVAA